MELLKKYWKKTIQKNRNGQILSTFDHIFYDRNYSKVCKFRGCTTSPSFLNSIVLIVVAVR